MGIMRITIILLFICSVSFGQDFEVYNSELAYSLRLSEINTKYGYPSKDYSKIINGKRVFFKCDTVVTRTYAREIPIPTEGGKYVFPVMDYVRKEFDPTKLVPYDKTWFPVSEIEAKMIE